jgi:hypothetical protein
LLHPLSSGSGAWRCFQLTPSLIAAVAAPASVASVFITAAFIAQAFIVAVSIAVVIDP